MIEGLKLKVPSAEIKEHCAKRAEYHKIRADEKTAMVPELKKSLETIKTAGTSIMPASISNISGKVAISYHFDPDDAIESLERDIAEHRHKVAVFEFYAGHLFDADYTLTQSDLVQLEMIRR